MEWHYVSRLGIGESEALALARQLRADWFLADDRAARVMAQSLGFEIHGSVGVLIWAADAGHLDREQSFAILDRLQRSSLWLSPRVHAQAENSLSEIFS